MGSWPFAEFFSDASFPNDSPGYKKQERLCLPCFPVAFSLIYDSFPILRKLSDKPLFSYL